MTRSQRFNWQDRVPTWVFIGLLFCSRNPSLSSMGVVLGVLSALFLAIGFKAKPLSWRYRASAWGHALIDIPVWLMLAQVGMISALAFLGRIVGRVLIVLFHVARNVIGRFHKGDQSCPPHWIVRMAQNETTTAVRESVSLANTVVRTAFIAIALASHPTIGLGNVLGIVVGSVMIGLHHYAQFPPSALGFHLRFLRIRSANDSHL